MDGGRSRPGDDGAAPDDPAPGLPGSGPTGFAAFAAALLSAATASTTTGLAICRPVDPGDPGTDFEVLHDNERCREELGVGPLTGRRLHEIFPAARGDLHQVYREVVADGGTRTVDTVFTSPQHPHLTERHFEVEAHGVDGLLVVGFRDVTETERAVRDLAWSERRYRALVEQASDVVHVIGPQGETRYVSPNFARLMGYAPERAAHMHYREFIVPEHHALAEETFAAVLAASPEETATVTLQVRAADGSRRWIEARVTNRAADPAIGGVLANWRDVTQTRALEHRLAHEAMHDTLTGLPNRRFLDELLAHCIARASRAEHRTALLFCDVDHFKMVNDSLGHDAGDALLVDVAKRLRSALRPSDVVARFSGDEFVVLCEDLDSDTDALTVAERIQSALHGDYRLAGQAATVTTSMGVTVLRPDSTGQDALSEADAALFEAKRAGRARVEAFTPSMRAHWRHRLDTEAGLRRALAEEELQLHWQPIIDLRDGRISHVEALLRWQPPGRQMIAPGDFLPVAEETGLIVDLGTWVLEAGIAQAARWQRELPDAPRVSLNVAGRQLHDPAFAATVEEMISRHRPAPEGLELEISERLLASDQPRLVSTLHRLREQGLHVGLDDFGAGQTAIAWLQQLPFDTLKLDRSLVKGLPAAGSSAVVHALAQLSERLDITSIAEGVETPEQLAAVSDLGCAHAQGFLLCRPAPAEELAPLLATGRIVRGPSPWGDSPPAHSPA
ncbi:PAS domain S-box-containing protein/diguanylate cyclase (GGDEF)-like protein [Kineococcus xinjiangensis]|uniref:PAS domain S-box-containing protein/diguanylate cyclase (GGDEF)-like protein n=1 Tax=Kineococcus xinjiangensis TaxID=512762 RepID=A0A2S6IH45_9ACTN|nr:EAL domain-containing protein [Kineococcus xinjiangensis]PPK93507.1 PAS domain S-box-containing protein/diguanylate cyclase (GGDEF)-like protein [Kineococcus xinjiangensis]